MTGTQVQHTTYGVIEALGASDAGVRLAAAMRAGTVPADSQIGPLVARSAVEPDFFVRDMLTWALVHHDHDLVIDRVLPELGSGRAQARSQALHTLSKIGGPRIWPALGLELLHDPDDEVARAAWRTAVRAVPPGEERSLAGMLASQLGRGSRDVRLSLSRALLALGESALPEIVRATSSVDDDVRTHALATARMIEDPDTAFDDAVEAATRARTLRGAPLVGDLDAHR